MRCFNVKKIVSLVAFFPFYIVFPCNASEIENSFLSLHHFGIICVLLLCLVFALFSMIVGWFVHDRKMRFLLSQIEQQNIELKFAVADAVRARDVARQTDNEKTRFLLRMSREIRRPMTKVSSEISSALININDRALLISHLKKSKNISTIVLGLITDLVDYSFIENQELEIAQEPLRIDELVHAICELYGDECVEKNLEFNVVSSVFIHSTVCSDAMRLTQILMNALAYSIKYSIESSVITFSAREVEATQKTVTYIFSIQSSNMSCSCTKVINSFFNPYVPKLEETDYLNDMALFDEESGLGLVIAKNLSEMMGGSLYFENCNVNSDTEMGGMFTLHMPFKICIPKTIKDDKDAVLATDENNENEE